MRGGPGSNDQYDVDGECDGSCSRDAGITLTGTANSNGRYRQRDDCSAPSLTADAPANYSGTYTITLRRRERHDHRTLKIPASVIDGGYWLHITWLGNRYRWHRYYAGATGGTFPTRSRAVGVDLVDRFHFHDFSGAGTITTGGTGGGGGTPVPTISAVQDAASNTPNIAQGSIFIVKGSNLSASGYTPFAPPRPQASGGVKVTFTPVAGGAGTDAYLVYLYNQGGVNQIACILPSTVAVGNYNVTVTNGTASAPVVAQVVANKVGLFTQDSQRQRTGFRAELHFGYGGGSEPFDHGLGQRHHDFSRQTRTGRDRLRYGTRRLCRAATTRLRRLFDFRSSLDIKAVVGGVSIPVDYAGRAGYAGEDQINFTLPANVQTGCAVPLQISVNGKLSAPTSIAIAPDANSTACVMPGFTTATVAKLR